MDVKNFEKSCNEIGTRPSNRCNEEVMISNMDYEKLYNAYYMQVYSYVMTLAKNRDLAEEITQNVFYKALSTQSKFRKGSGELTWLCSIAKNTFYDEMRRQRHIADPLQEEDQPASEDVEQAITNKDSAYQIHKILHNLDEPYK